MNPVSLALQQAAQAFRGLQSHTTQQMLDVCQRAATLYVEATLEGESPQLYLQRLAQSSGLPYTLGRMNLEKIAHLLRSQSDIVRGLSRNVPFEVLDRGWGEGLSFFPSTRALAVILPSNSPGVNGLWQVCLPLRIPLVLKPGPLDPWTPRRIVAALRAAGAPPEAHTILDTDHAGCQQLAREAERVVIFGHNRTTALFADGVRVQKHGTGHSKIVFGPDAAANWADHLELLVDSVLSNSGRSCINTSSIYTPAYGAEIAEALARRLGPIGARPLQAEDALLGAFPQAETAAEMDRLIKADLPGAREVTADHREGRRLVELDGLSYLRPTVVHCPSPDHPLADREFHFPFVSVVDVPAHRLVTSLGHPLVVTAITQDESLRRELLGAAIPRLNLGAIATSRVAWTQPHAGNLFDFLYERRALQLA